MNKILYFFKNIFKKKAKTAPFTEVISNPVMEPVVKFISEPIQIKAPAATIIFKEVDNTLVPEKKKATKKAANKKIENKTNKKK